MQAGLNEITISDLTSTADPDSIRVSGTTDNHPARINDLTVDLVPNKTSYTPDYSDSDDDSEEEKDEEPVSLKAAKEAWDNIKFEIQDMEERRNSVQKELSLLEQYTSSSTTTTGEALPTPETIKTTLELYNNQRAIHYESIKASSRKISELQKEGYAKAKLVTKLAKEHTKSLRGKVEERKKKQEAKAEKRREKQETKPERSANVYRVRITIELPSSDLTSAIEESAEVFQEATLILTYTTSSASWTPHYDLRLDTTNPSFSTLTYRAQFTNRTYETWTHAALTLSTSQASFGGLKEKIPQMEGWRVTLGRKWQTASLETGENGLYSLAEVMAKKEAEEKEYGHDIAALVRAREREGGSRAKGMSTSKKRFVSSSVAPQFQAPGSWGAAPQMSYGAPPPPPAPLARFAPSSPGYSPTSPTYSPVSAGGESEGEDEDVATLALGGKAIEHSLAGSDTYGYASIWLAFIPY